MRKRAARLVQSRRLKRWGGSTTLLLVLAVLAGMAALMIAGTEVQRNIERVQAAQTDNTTWLISQIEVDLLKFHQATLRATQVPHQVADLLQVRSRYDVLFSRADTISANMDKAGWFGADDLRQDWHRLDTSIRALGTLVDLPDPQLSASLPLLISKVEEQAEATRNFSLNALMLMVNDSASRREALQDLLHKYSSLSVFLILLLMAIACGAIVLLDRLQIRAAENERMKANIEKAIEASLDAVLVADARGRIITYNSAAQSIFGFSRAEALGSDFVTLLIPERLREGHSEALAPFDLRQGGPIVDRGRRVLVAQRKDGREFPMEATVVSDHDVRGQMIYFGFFRDISEQIQIEANLKRARDAALRSEEAKSRFLAVMSHEMRTPLNGLVAAIDIVTETTDLSDKQAHFLRLARSCSMSALEQVNDVLELTRLDEGQLQEERGTFDAIGLILEIVEQSRPMAEQRYNSLQLSLPSAAAPHIQGYRRLFAQALFNLLGNAIKFTDTGMIAVSAQFSTLPDGTPILRVEVSDTGIGIPEGKLAGIFEDFETLDGSYSRDRQGTGLGLGIARRAVAVMGGEIGVESRLGVGSTFWFSVPLVTPDAKGGVARAPARIAVEVAPVARQGLQILVAEDNVINREVLREMLEHCRQHVTEATNGFEAVEHAQKKQFDMVLMDISMPVMDGIEAAIRIRSGGASASTPIVGLTAHAFPEELASFRASGMDEMIVKPITLAKLQDLLSRRGPAPLVQGAVQVAAEPAEAPQQAPLIDTAVFGDLCSLLDPARHMAAMTDLERELAKLLEYLRSDSADAAGISSFSHRIGGAAAVLGALRLRVLLSETEAGVIEDRSALVEAVDKCGQETLLAMRSRLTATDA